jgi:hypothetical protein
MEAIMAEISLASVTLRMLEILDDFAGSADAADHIASTILSLAKAETEELKQRLLLKRLCE